MRSSNSIYTILCLFLTFLVFNSKAQENNLLRGEISAKDYNYVYFIPIGEEGLINIMHQKKYHSSSTSWEIQHFSKNLQKKDAQEFSTDIGFKLQDYYLEGDSVFYGFFAESGGSRKFQIFRYNIPKRTIKIINGLAENRAGMERFHSLNGVQFISGLKYPSPLAYLGQVAYSLTTIPFWTGSKVYSIKPQIIRFDLRLQTQQLIEPLKKGNSTILYSQSNAINNTYAVVIKNTLKKKTTIHFMEYNLDGILKYHRELEQSDPKNILSISLIVDKQGRYDVIGTYNNDLSWNQKGQAMADGIFTAKIEDGQWQYQKYHPFTEFTHAKNALSYWEKRRFDKRNRKGKEMDLSFRLLVHNQIIDVDSLNVVLMESYYPEYHYETYNNMYGSMYSNQVFDGYRFTNAITAAFNKQGDLLWDNFFEIKGVLTYNLDENVVVYFDGKSQVMMNYSDGKIYSKVVEGKETVFRNESSEVSTVGPNERVVYENYGRIYHWYDKYFLLTAYQQVIDERGKKRKVFCYIKLKFE